ncbi:hypothetical protein EXW96_22795 [Paenibacillus sp. JMULE4]|uniref:hypothetical protein n=1 Tax=Paenibacillus sp. JMULE4 TaxID=2518342 RepID=UPI0015768462|nr:hypothetical protein [Paenibacillus sp. JMULE4]NTZ20269.1 hypothetical protein [Paenibacillus sp. JMULE4]
MFERPIYTTVIWSSLALFLLFLSNISDWKKNSFDMKANLVWIIPLCYMISLIQAASHFSAVNVLFIHITFAMFFLVSAKITINKIGYLLLPNILQYSTYIVVIYGFMNWFGNAHYQDAVFQNRLTSVFQYPNSYGAFLIGALISSLFLIVNARKWYDAVIHYLMLVPIFTSLFLTLSRGSLMILPFVVIIILLMMPLFNQVLILVGLILSGIASLLILNKLMNIGTQLHQTFNVELSMSGWAILIVTSIVVSLIFIGINILGKK